MIILESVPAVDGSLCITKGRVILQCVEEAIITEYKISILFDDGDPLNISIQWWGYYGTKCVKINQDVIDFGTVSYTCVPSTTVLQTGLPRLSCVCTIPELKNGPVTMQVETTTLTIGTARIPTLFYARPSPPVVIDGGYIPSGTCRVYVCDKDTPVAFETSSTIIYVAPIETFSNCTLDE